MPKPEKLKYTAQVLCGAAPMTDHPDQKKWYEYGVQSGVLIQHYNDTQNRALLPLIFERCETEIKGWLALDDYGGAAKQCLTIEALMVSTGCDTAAVKEAMDRTDDYIRRSTKWPKWHDELVAVRDFNRNEHSMLASCAYCGKCLQKRNFCKKCMIAMYCDQQCQQKHWDEGHRELCGKQKHCKTCKKLLEKPLRCTRCKAAFYCNTDHQKHDWDKCHKHECKKA
jgi:hypothetical protein